MDGNQFDFNKHLIFKSQNRCLGFTGSEIISKSKSRCKRKLDQPTGLSPEPHACLGLCLPELQGAQALTTHPQGTDMETKAQQSKVIDGLAQGHRSLAGGGGERAAGYLTQATRSPEQPGLYLLQCVLLLLLQTGLN